MDNFKHIHIGQMIEKRVAESGIEGSRLCNFLKCTEENLVEMYNAKSLDTEILLKWSKILAYDFFRIYTQHLILYAPPSAQVLRENKKSNMPQFRKNLYTKEIIDFVIEMLRTNEMTTSQIIEKYRIPKTTLYKWIEKYGK